MFGGVGKMLYFCEKLQNMLGVNTHREPVKSAFARKMQEELLRAQSGELNDTEKAQKEKDAAAASKYNIVWN